MGMTNGKSTLPSAWGATANTPSAGYGNDQMAGNWAGTPGFESALQQYSTGQNAGPMQMPAATQPAPGMGLAAAPQAVPQQPAVPQWQQQYQQLQTNKANANVGPDYLAQMMAMMQQPKQNTTQQAYMNMMGGGNFGGIIPQQSQGTPIFRPPAQSEPQKNNVSFGQSPWPGVWGGV